LGYDVTRFTTSEFLNIKQMDTVKYRYGPFFAQLGGRPGGYSEEELLGPGNTNNLIDAVTKDYCELMRHVIDRNLRASNESSHAILGASNETSTAAHSEVIGVYSARVTHLVTDTTSKLVLQILLAATTALGFVGFVFVKIRGTVPRDPCSIGSTMSFLAGSNLCDPGAQIIPSSAEYLSENKLSQALEGWVFSLGWWRKEMSRDSSSQQDGSGISDIGTSGRDVMEGIRMKRDLA
jgi:hypothetical protein